MRGTITDRHVLAHPLTIARAFGLALLFHALAAIVLRTPCTFLSLVARFGR